MIKEITTYSLDDLCIVPAVTSSISSRKECNPYYGNKLPIFVAPMSCVISEDNFDYWDNLPLEVIVPRSCSIEYRKKMFKEGTWVAVGLDEWDSFIDLVKVPSSWSYKILIDVANGHMRKLVDMIIKARQKYNRETLQIMVGNIANPETYRVLSQAGANYVRCSVGSGIQCITSTQTSIHYPMATLIAECQAIAKELNIEYGMFDNHKFHYPAAKIIADGGMRQYRDIITALACGADYVMVGSLFGAMWESAAEWHYKDNNGIISSPKNLDCATWEELQSYYASGKIYKVLYGMASRKAQKEIASANGSVCLNKTSEGKTSVVECTGHVENWLKNFEDYLRSAMSYTGAYTLSQFKTQTVLIPCSLSERSRINA